MYKGKITIDPITVIGLTMATSPEVKILKVMYKTNHGTSGPAGTHYVTGETPLKLLLETITVKLHANGCTEVDTVDNSVEVIID